MTDPAEEARGCATLARAYILLPWMRKRVTLMFDFYVETDQISPELRTACILFGADVEEMSIEWTRVRSSQEDWRDALEGLCRSEF